MHIYDLISQFKRMYPMTLAWRLKAHANFAEEVLASDEELRFVFAAQKNESQRDFMSTNIVMITTKRVIFVHKRIFPGYFISALSLSMINDVTTKSGMLWGKVIIDSVKETVTLSNLDIRSLDIITEAFSELLHKDLKQKHYY